MRSFFFGWLVARDAFPKNYGNPTKHKEGDHIELHASCTYHVLVLISHFEIPLGDFESWVNINMFRHDLLMYIEISQFNCVFTYFLVHGFSTGLDR